MRRQAKPFVVEVKKNRKSPGKSDGAEPLIAFEEFLPTPPSSPPPLWAAERVFSRFAGGADEALGMSGPAAAVADARRILPDLTPAPAPAPVAAEVVDVEPAKKRGRPRKEAAAVVEAPAKPKAAPRKPSPAPAPVARRVAAKEPVVVARPKVAAAALVAAPAKKRTVLTRRQARRAEVRLPAGQRWKRRLPPALR